MSDAPSNLRKKELSREYRERKQRQGVYAVHCDKSGDVWIGGSRNLDAQKNQIWFILESGRHPTTTLQAAWKAYGRDTFRYEILEEVEDENALLIPARLKDRTAHWRDKTGAKAMTG